MNAIKFLLNEHNKARKSFAAISSEAKRFATKQRLFNDLKQDLIRHEKMEHKILYRYLRKNKDTNLQQLIEELIAQENFYINEFKNFKSVKTQDEWEALFEKIKLHVEQHASDEESKLFPIVEKLVKEDVLNSIGAKFREFKKQVVAKTR